MGVPDLDHPLTRHSRYRTFSASRVYAFLVSELSLVVVVVLMLFLFGSGGCGSFETAFACDPPPVLPHRTSQFLLVGLLTLGPDHCMIRGAVPPAAVLSWLSPGWECANGPFVCSASRRIDPLDYHHGDACRRDAWFSTLPMRTMLPGESLVDLTLLP